MHTSARWTSRLSVSLSRYDELQRVTKQKAEDDADEDTPEASDARAVFFFVLFDARRPLCTPFTGRRRHVFTMGAADE